MNETLNTIFKRRSVRSFLDKQITKEELEMILKAGTYAPSGMNLQSPYFVAIQNEDLINELQAISKEKYPTKQNFFYNAKTIVIVFSKRNSDFFKEDASLALENMFLAATSLGIGSCWINYLKDLFKDEEKTYFLKKIGVDEEYAVVGTCILGYPKEVPAMKERKGDYYKIIE